MVILDGNSYDTRVVEAGEERDEDLDACALLLNNKGTPLLVSGAGEHAPAARFGVMAAAAAGPWPRAGHVASVGGQGRGGSLPTSPGHCCAWPDGEK